MSFEKEILRLIELNHPKTLYDLIDCYLMCTDNYEATDLVEINNLINKSIYRLAKAEIYVKDVIKERIEYIEKYVKEEMYVDEKSAKENKYIQLGHIKTIKEMIK